MQQSIFLVFLFIFSYSFSQNVHQGLVVDSELKTPVEFVGVYNGIDHTMTNADGEFLFSSNADSVIFYRVGYQKFSTTFAKLRDTVFLVKSPFELDEVVVTNKKTLWQKIGDSIKSNYSFEPYKEKFLLRGVLKYNDTITRIQDIQGKLQRRTLLYANGMEIDKKDYLVELTNMRKIGIVKDEHNVYFKYPTLYGLFSSFIRTNATGEGFELTEKPFDNGTKFKIEFQSNLGEKGPDIQGYYVINGVNNAIEEFNMTSKFDNAPYREKKWLKFRSTRYELKVLFEKDHTKGKYFMSSAKSREIIEITDTSESFHETYDMSFIMTTSDNFSEFGLKKNVNIGKDIFKLKYPYDKKYWESQNQLLLTKEMLHFIEQAGKNNKEFKIRTNIKN